MSVEAGVQKAEGCFGFFYWLPVEKGDDFFCFGGSTGVKGEAGGIEKLFVDFGGGVGGGIAFDYCLFFVRRFFFAAFVKG